jgi:hypothetical protein
MDRLNVIKQLQHFILCNIIQLLHLNEINMRFYGAEYNNIETSYWSSSSVVIALFYSNFEIFWKSYEIFVSSL